MAKENIEKDILIIKNTNKLTGNIGIYRQISLFKDICKKYKDYPGFNSILNEIKDIDVLNGKGLEKMSELGNYKKSILDSLETIIDFENSKKTLKACINTCKKYYDALPNSFLTNQKIYKDFRQQKMLFKNRLQACEKLSEKLYNNEVNMKKFCVEVNNIKKAILGTIKEIKSYGFTLENNIKESYFNY